MEKRRHFAALLCLTSIMALPVIAFLLLADYAWSNPANHAPSFIQSQAYWIGDDPRTTDGVEWHPYTGTLALGFGPQPVWVELNVSPLPDLKSSAPIELSLRPTYLDQIDLYDPLRDSALPKSTGRLFPLESNARPALTYNFDLPNGTAPRKLLLRIKNVSTRQVEITALPAPQSIYWNNQLLTESHLKIFTLAVFLAWGIYNWATHKDRLTGSFVVMQCSAVIYAFVALGFARLYLSDDIAPTILADAFKIVLVGYVYILLWFYIKLIEDFRPKRWAKILLHLHMGTLAVVAIAYLMGNHRLCLQINTTNAFLACISLFLVSCFGLQTKEADSNDVTLPRWVMIGYFGALLFINILQAGSRLNLWTPKLALSYDGTLSALLSGILLIVIMHSRSKKIDRLQAYRLATESLRADSERTLRERQSHFVDMMAHELKTPLSVVTLALRSQSSSGKMRALASSAASSINDVILRCQQATQLAENRLTLYTIPINIRAHLLQIIDGFRQKGRIHFTSTFEGIIYADRDLLSAILSNLLDNALKYGDPEYPVDVALSQDSAQQIRIAVYNQIGKVGVPDENHLFEKHYRAPAARKCTGSGLGLYLTKNLAELQGGKIEYKKCDEHRVCFCVLLPIRQDSPGNLPHQ